MIKEAIILAGGLGTRLRSAVPDLPKCMAPVAGKPFLAWLLEFYKEQGISHFIFSLGYKHEIVEDFVETYFSEKNISYEFSVEDEPLGTGGAAYKAASRASSPKILLMNGDTFFQTDIRELSIFHETTGADCSLSLKPLQDFDRYGVVEINAENSIISFKEKKHYSNGLINGGVYAINRSAFLAEKFPSVFSFEKDYLETLYPERKFFGFVQEGYFIDIGIPEDYHRADKYFSEQGGIE